MPRARTLSALIAALVASGAFAQQQQEEKKPEQKEQALPKVTVTGSNVRRVDTETVAPVTIITREQIEKSGRATVADVLRDIPINSANSFSETSLNSFASGGAGISLRGLGGLGTLVLINGRRVANYPFAANLDEVFVDVNQIPASVVERIEILKDGASALYGSDAIAGVVNVIFRKDFKGGEVYVRAGQETRNKGLKDGNAAITFGKGDLGADGFNVFGVLDLYKRNGTLRSEFPLTESDNYGRFYAGDDLRGSTGGTWRAVTGPVAGTRVRYPVDNCQTELIPASQLSPLLSGTSCAGDFSPRATSLIPDTQRLNFYTRATFDINPTLQAFAEVGASVLKSDVLQDYNYLTAGATRFARTTVNGENFLTPESVRYVIAPGEAGNPTGQFAELLIPSFDLGVQRQDITSNNYKVMGGLAGSHFGWDWDSALGITRSKAKSTTKNVMSYSGLVDTANLAPPVAFVLVNGAIAGEGSYLPIGANAPEVIESIRTSMTRKSETEVIVADLKGSRELMQLPAGPLGLAMGVDVRREKIKDTPDAQLVAGDILNYGYTGTEGSRTAGALYAELAVPVNKAIEVQAALRRDQYSDFGGATSPKLGAKFKLREDVLFRANYGKGFRAPSLPQISNSDSTAFTRYFDYVGCNDGAGYAPACQGITTGTGSSVGTIIRSNKDLQPERSETTTLGFVIAPSADTSFSVDYYRLRWTNVVATQDIQNILDDEYVLGISRPDVLIRDPLNGSLIGVINKFTNVGRILTKGVDFDFRHRLTTSLGKLAFQLEASYVDEFKSSNQLPQYLGGASELTEFAGGNTSSQGAFPRWRGNLRGEWEYNDFTFGTRLNMVGRYRQGAPDVNFRGEPRPDRIKAHYTLDLNAQYRWGKNLRLFAGVSNVQDKMPPFDPRQDSYGFAVDQYAPVGRTVYMTARYTFD